MRLYKHALLGGVAALALGGFTAGTTSTAEAFDKTNWKWDLAIDTKIDELVSINIAIDPVGKVLDEVMQIQIGDVKSSATVSNIYNWKPLEEVSYKTGYSNEFKLTVDSGYAKELSGSGGFEGGYTAKHSTTESFAASLDGSLRTEGRGVPFFIGGAGVIGGFFTDPGPDGAAGAGVIGAIGAYGSNGYAKFDADLSGSTTHGVTDTGSLVASYNYSKKDYGDFDSHLNVDTTNITTIYTLAPAVQDALKELPKVAAASTSIGNMISIESDTAVQESSLQVVFDDIDPKKYDRRDDRKDYRFKYGDSQFDLDADLNLQDAEPNLDTGNYNHDVALLLALSAGAGLIEQADITAESKVYNIWNAQVDSTATAIGNIKSIDVETLKNDNGLIMADITQLSIANVSSTASAKDINIINYTNLGKLTDPIAKATATSIGNAVNIKLNSGQGIPTNTP